MCSNFACEWKLIIAEYHTHLDDLEFVRKAGRPFSTADANTFCCELCANVVFQSQKALDQHKRVKHKIRTPVADLVGDISKCPVCLTDFGSRVRLITHLSDRRIRSKVRKTNCHYEFIKRSQYKIDSEQLAVLHSKDSDARKAANKNGHMHVLADRPAKRNAPSVLKKARSEQPRRRLRGKQRPPPIFVDERPVKKRKTLCVGP